MQKVIDGQTQVLATTGYSVSGPSIDARKAKTISAQCNVTVNTPSAKVFGSVSGNSITIPAHGLPTGLVGQCTTTGGLPSGLSTSTNYYVIVIDANTIQLASSLVNAKAATAVTLSSAGTGTNTFTPTALAGCSVQLMKSNDNVTFSADGSPVSVATTGTYWLEKTLNAAAFWQIQYTLTAGSIASSSAVIIFGDF